MEKNTVTDFLTQVKKDVADGRFTVLDAVKGEGPFRFTKGDYGAFVNHARACIILMNDRVILSQLNQEIGEELSKHLSAERVAASSRDVKSKDGTRLIGKLGGLTKQIVDDSPSLLTGKTFSECIANIDA